MVTKNKKKAKARPASAKGLAVGQSGANQWGKARSQAARSKARGAAAKARPVGKSSKGTGFYHQQGSGDKPMKGKGTAVSGVATSSSRKALKARPKGPIAPPSDNKLNAMRKRQARKGPAKSPLGARNLPLSKKK